MLRAITVADLVLTIGNKFFPVSGYTPGFVMQIQFLRNVWMVKVTASHVTRTKVLCTKPTKRQVRKFVKQTKMFDNSLSKHGTAYGARMNCILVDKFHNS